MHFVEIEIDRPRENFPGRTCQGVYTLEDNTVTLTDRVGTPVRDPDGKSYTQKLNPGEDARQVAGRLTRQFRKALRGGKEPKAGFSGPINYPKLGIV